MLGLFLLLCHVASARVAVTEPPTVPTQVHSVHCQGRVCALFEGKVPNATAWATFTDSVNQTGWAQLHVHSNAAASALNQAFAAGYLEASITTVRTFQHKQNMFEETFSSPVSSDKAYVEAAKFLTDNDAFVSEQVRTATLNGQVTDADFWLQVGLVWEQLGGMVQGHKEHASPPHQMTRLDFLFVNALVDLSSLIHKPFAENEWTIGRIAEFKRKTTHCSAIVRVTPNNSELFTSHNTWTGFYTMLRTVKEYDLPFAPSPSPVVARKMLFPGYFGTLSSLDDFFVLSSGLVVQETTNGVTNTSLLAAITPRSVLTWVRTLVANRMATDGKTWTEWFAKQNSGTINNQWMVVDYNKFEPGKPLKDGTLTILEQLPLYIKTADVTSYLRLGYWPSYNQPFFEETRQLSGANVIEAKFGPSYSYSLDPRAKIFRRDAPGVIERDQLKNLQRYNRWQDDPFAAAGYGGQGEPRSPENQIAARFDLIPSHESGSQAHPERRSAFGNIDAKMVSSSDVKNMRFEGVSGPTHDDQPVFSYVGEWASSPHHGQPTTFDFDWLTFAVAS